MLELSSNIAWLLLLQKPPFDFERGFFYCRENTPGVSLGMKRFLGRGLSV